MLWHERIVKIEKVEKISKHVTLSTPTRNIHTCEHDQAASVLSSLDFDLVMRGQHSQSLEETLPKCKTPHEV